MVTVRVRLDELMRQRGIGYDRLEAATGVPVRVLFNTRKGLTWPSRRTIEKLCEYFDVGPGELFAVDR
jgi:DNA-binding Xre family transcriptional regulator